MAFHVVSPATRVGERQLPHPDRAPAQPEDIAWLTVEACLRVVLDGLRA
ncbi:MAG TPA: hypothetical protein VMA72_05275 [Streptosporangiaceae bacterium]|nr:hypothetical protein [Streptosporangiaceae bacterium]